MTDVTRILSAIEQGDPSAAEQLLPLVYDELRKLAAARMAQEKPGQTLQPTALVHEAYLRIVGNATEQSWDSRRHFFAAAAEAMRRILVDNFRHKSRKKHGGAYTRVELQEFDLICEIPSDDLLDLDEALRCFSRECPKKADLVNLRCFVGLSLKEAAETLGISRATASRHWTYARAWLYDKIQNLRE